MPQRTRGQVRELSGLSLPAGMGSHTRRSTDVKILASNGAVSPIRRWRGQDEITSKKVNERKRDVFANSPTGVLDRPATELDTLGGLEIREARWPVNH